MSCCVTHCGNLTISRGLILNRCVETSSFHAPVQWHVFATNIAQALSVTLYHTMRITPHSQWWCVQLLPTNAPQAMHEPEIISEMSERTTTVSSAHRPIPTSLGRYPDRPPMLVSIPCWRTPWMYFLHIIVAHQPASSFLIANLLTEANRS